MSEYAYQLYLTIPGRAAVEVTELCRTVSWSGSVRQTARELAAGLAIPRDGSVPAPPIQQGAIVSLRSGGKGRFMGPLVTAATDSQSAVTDLNALDRAWYLVQNEGWLSFRDVTPEQAAASIAATYGFTLGETAKTGVKVSRKFPGVALDKVLTTLYTLAGETTGKRYLVGFDGSGRLTVREKGTGAEKTVESTMSVTNTWDITAMQNSAAIRTEDGKLVRRVEDGKSMALSGRLEHVVVQRGGQDAEKEAEAWLEDHGLRQSLTVQLCPGDPELLTGAAVELRDTGSGVSGLFWVDGDVHTWRNGIYTTRLTLNFRNLMNETTAGSELKE